MSLKTGRAHNIRRSSILHHARSTCLSVPTGWSPSSTVHIVLYIHAAEGRAAHGCSSIIRVQAMTTWMAGTTIHIE